MALPATPSISVVVPTFNRCASLRRTLHALAAQEVQHPFEVVVVSDGSTDGTDQLLSKGVVGLQLTAVTQANAGPAAARNTGVAHARGDLIVFVDDDVVPDPRLLEAHLAAHQRAGDRAVVIGPMLGPPNHTPTPWTAWEQVMLDKQYDAMAAEAWQPTAMQFYTGNASVHAELVRAAGGFDETLWRAEDIELAFRLADCGATFHFEPSARGWHYADRSYDSWRAAAHAYGRNAVEFARGRPWIFDFLSYSWARQHPLIRGLVRVSVRHRFVPAACSVIEDAAAVQRQRPSRLTRYGLSAIYALEYYSGVAEELASHRAFIEVCKRGSAVERLASATDNAPRLGPPR